MLKGYEQLHSLTLSLEGRKLIRDAIATGQSSTLVEFVNRKRSESTVSPLPTSKKDTKQSERAASRIFTLQEFIQLISAPVSTFQVNRPTP